jgi:hypothetical protein
VAQRNADLAQTDEHRSSWLRIAQGWMSMIKRQPPTAREAFDDETRARRTGPSSDESN